MPRTSEWKEEQDLLNAALDTLQRVEELEPITVEFDLHQQVSIRTQRHYEGMLRVYHLLLTGGGIGFTFDPRGKELPSFLFNLEEIFERFVRKTFVRGFRDAGITTLDGYKHQGRLFEDTDVYRTKPDLIFRRSREQVIALGDAKYKIRLKANDRYQLISHVTAARAPIGILFRPTREGESQRLERIGRLSTGAEFYHYLVDIQDDISASQERMIEDVQTLLSVA